MIRELYDLEKGSFDALTGSVELPAPSCPPGEEPQLLVLSSGGTGIPVYRMLQRQGQAFIAGILYTNDLDYRTARLLASEVIEEKAFEEISDPVFERAMECVHSCRRVIDAGVPVGTLNRRVGEILAAAAEQGKLEKWAGKRL